jgi:Tfp pilus assembly protein PilF
MVAYDEFKKDIPLFVEAGLIAIKQGDEDSAKKLFQGVEVIDPNHPTIPMGQALVSLHKMELAVAEKKFLEVLQKDSNNYQAKAFLSFTYILSAMEEKNKDKQINYLKTSTELAQDVLQNSDVETTKTLARSVLDWEMQLIEKAKDISGR